MHGFHADADFYLVAVQRRAMMGDLAAPDQPTAAAGRGPVAPVAGGLRVLGRDLLRPVQIDGVVDVSVLVQLVAAHPPSDAEEEWIDGDLATHGLKSQPSQRQRVAVLG